MGFYLLCTQKAYTNDDEFGIEFSLSLVKNSLSFFKKNRSKYNVIGYNKEDIFGH